MSSCETTLTRAMPDPSDSVLPEEPSAVLPGRPAPLTDSEFRRIRTLVYERFGINLTEQKRSLVVGRLQKVLRERNLPSFAEYIRYLRDDASGAAVSELVNCITTNHTYFYRESGHFEFFTRVLLPGLVERLERKGSRDLRIWCAGCSSGEEAYTLAMLMIEFLGQRYPMWEAGVLATDISATALARARRGVYLSEKLGALPPALRKKYFKRVSAENEAVADCVRNEVTFGRFNLMNAHFPFRKPFHAIFCRNVMIYFDQPTREALVNRFHSHTAPGGYFFVGHAESLDRRTCPYQYIQPAVYQKK